MSAPSLRKAAAVSAALHFMFVVLAVLIVRHANRFAFPSPYMVSIVPVTGGPAESTNRGDEEGSALDFRRQEETTFVETRIADLRTKEDFIRELEAKKEIEERFKRRRTVDVASKSQAISRRPAGAGRGGPGATYIDRITAEIRREWVFPDFGDTNLEAIVSVKISKDGQITIVEFEKKSGNLLFDKSVLKALNSASPVTPPQEEMEIGIRFYP